jgi:hypothetical protein
MWLSFLGVRLTKIPKPVMVKFGLIDYNYAIAKCAKKSWNNLAVRDLTDGWGIQVM